MLYTRTVQLGMKTDRSGADNIFFISLSTFFCCMLSESDITWMQFRVRIFRMLEMVRNRTGFGADTNYYSRIVHAYIYLFIQMNNSQKPLNNKIIQETCTFTIDITIKMTLTVDNGIKHLTPNENYYK